MSRGSRRRRERYDFEGMQLAWWEYLFRLGFFGIIFGFLLALVGSCAG